MDKSESNRALEHIQDYGCQAYHPEGSCEWQQRCDEPGCVKETSCGTPTENGYRRTCYGHRP